MNDMDSIIYPDGDSLLRLTLAGNQARAVLCRVTRAAQEAGDIHGASDVAITAMGRLLAAGGLMSSALEEEEASITLVVSGDGPGGRMTLVARPGRLKITVEEPQADLPLRSDGKQDVAGFVGHSGKLTVVRDTGAGEPHVGISNLISGELGLDIAEYFLMSEQKPSLVALGCLNQDGKVLSAGGIMIQTLPGCSDKTIEQLEIREPFFRGISREIYDRSLRELAEGWFEGLSPVFMGEEPLMLACDCSRGKMEQALLALGRQELLDIAQSGEETEMVCHFCRTRHLISASRVRELLGSKLSGEDSHANH